MLMQSAIKIREYRAQNSLSLEEFGARFGAVKRQTVWKWERSHKAASARIMKEMADANVCALNDWFTPFDASAACALCSVRSDDPSVWQCDKAECPNAHRKVAAPQAEEVL